MDWTAKISIKQNSRGLNIFNCKPRNNWALWLVSMFSVIDFLICEYTDQWISCVKVALNFWFTLNVKHVHVGRMLLKRGMGNGEWEIGNGEWEMEMGNWKWKLSIFYTLTFYNVKYFFSAAIINTHVSFWNVMCKTRRI